MARFRPSDSPFYRFNSSPEIIKLVVLMYVKYPLSDDESGPCFDFAG